MGNSQFIGQCQEITDSNIIEEVLVIAGKTYEDMNNKNKDSNYPSSEKDDIKYSDH